MSNSKNPILDSVRILPRESDYLDRKVGSRGEVFFDQQDKTLRLYDGIVPGGIPLLKADLTNAQGVIGAALGDTPPVGENVKSGTIWFNTSNGRLYILFDDGTSTQWIQPTTPSYGSGSGGGAQSITELTDTAISNPVSGQVLKYNGTAWVNGTDNTAGSGAVNVDDLGDVVITSPVSGQVLKYNGTAWVNGTDNTSTGGSGDVTSIIAGTNITISPTDGKGNVTINAAAVQEFALLTDVLASGLTLDEIAYQAITRLNVTPNGATAYLFTQYSGDNPTIYAITGTTIAFQLELPGHPIFIQNSVGTDFSDGLVHVTTGGVVSTGAAAQGQRTGTLYWRIPKNAAGNYRYQCGLHPPMVGSIVVKDIAAL